ncbi:MAG: DUF4388 domain-containing protein [bacterium]|nr:DUF4388 domain-containing protein [bacterium]
MIPNADQLQAIAKLQHGDLAEVPFAVLLYALAVHQRSGVIEIERRPLRKEILLEEGVPVDCRSNLLHETLGRFMVAQEVITEAQAQICLAKSATHGLPIGEILILEGLISASDLFKVLQQNLAKKLLDGFTWRSGTFRVLPELPEVDSPLKVNAPQLVLTGISKFALDEEVNEAVGPLVGKELFVHPSPPYPLSELHLTNEQKQLTTLLEGGKRVDELAAATTIPFDKIMRLLYSLAIIGIVVPGEQMPATPVAAPTPEPAPAPPPVAAAPAPAVVEVADPANRHDEVMEAYLKYRKQDAFDLLGMPETASLVDIQQHYLDFSRRFAPWRFTTPQLESLAEKAEDLFLAGGMAFGELCDADRRNALITRRRALREESEKRPDPERFAIKSELLDPEVQFKKGKALMEAGKYHEARQQLQFAYDCDPQNSIYRAELAYCRFMDVPSVETQKSLNSLRETIRIDPNCGLAFFYAGDIHRELGNVEEGEHYLRKAMKMMMPDRRPIESLKALQSKKKRRR